MSDCSITYFVPEEVYSSKAYNRLIGLSPNIDELLVGSRNEAIQKIPENHEILRNLLAIEFKYRDRGEVNERSPFFIYVDKGKQTKTIDETSKHLGIPPKRVSKSVFFNKKENPKKLYLFSVLGKGPVHTNSSICIVKKKDARSYLTDSESLFSLKNAEPEVIERKTGMSPGWCGPFPLNEDYLKNIEGIYFRKTYSRMADFVDIAISPTEAIFMPAKEVYTVLKNSYPEKVFIFIDN